MAQVSIETAQRAQAAGNYKLAEQQYWALMAQLPDRWEPVFFYCSLLLQTNRNALAIPLLFRAGELNPKQHEIWNNLGTLLRQEMQMGAAEEVLLKALKLAPDSPDVLNNLATLYINEGRPGLAEDYTRRALNHEPDRTQAKWNLALALLEQGKVEEAWRYYAEGSRGSDRIERWPSFPYWDGSTKGRVLVSGEQGLGDEIMFLSMIPDLIDKVGEENVILEHHPRLSALLQRSFPNIDLRPTRKQNVLEDDEPPMDTDFRVPIGDLGRWFRCSHESFPRTPYLKADEDMVLEMLEMLHEKAVRTPGRPEPLIGIGWKGGYKKTHKTARSIPVETFRPLEEVGSLISMQYTPEADQEVHAYNEAGGHLHHWPSIVRADDYDHTAALAMALDHVVCVNTTLVHLCGALGRPCYTLTPQRAAWRYYPYHGKMLWYDSVTMVREHGTRGWGRGIAWVKKQIRRSER